MKLFGGLQRRKARAGERGQAIMILAASVVALLAMVAVVIDTGNIYQAHQELAAASDAAALAGAYDLPTTSTATATADAIKWSAATGGTNTSAKLSNVTIATSFKCLTTVGVNCFLPTGGATTINAIQVVETAKVKPLFAEILGIHSFNIAATATAIPRAGTAGPVDLMLVLDTTASMATADTSCTVPGKSNPTREDCALYAVRTLLMDLNPCQTSLAVCGAATKGQVSNPVGEVGLMTFPGLTPSQTKTLDNPPVQAPTSSVDFSCPGGDPSITSYNNNPGYMVLPFQSDYRTADGTTSLNTGSALVVAAGGAGCSNGLADPGGEGTFYAGAITAAQNYLIANSRTNVTNVMILLSDGDATADSTQMKGSATSYSATNECHQAVTAAQNARTAGITVYSIAYGAEAAGCTTDSPAITPCQTMMDIASTPTGNYFFADSQTGVGGIVGGSCVSAARPISSLNDAFSEISQDLSSARLVPNNTN
jgi:Flp pilus assembly protein TadG